MSDTELLTEIRDLLRIMAEPQIAERDARLRKELSAIVGRGKKQSQAVLRMDGTLSQSQIAKECDIDQGQLSRLVKALQTKGLLDQKNSRLKIIIPIPTNFFEKQGEDNDA